MPEHAREAAELIRAALARLDEAPPYLADPDAAWRAAVDLCAVSREHLPTLLAQLDAADQLAGAAQAAAGAMRGVLGGWGKQSADQLHEALLRLEQDLLAWHSITGQRQTPRPVGVVGLHREAGHNERLHDKGGSVHQGRDPKEG